MSVLPPQPLLAAAREMPEVLTREWAKGVKRIFGPAAEKLEHSALKNTLKEMATKLGLPYIPEIYRAAEFPAAYGGKAAQAMAYHNRNPRETGAVILFTDRMLETLGFAHHTAEIPAEMKAIIGHEMGHFIQKNSYREASLTLPLILGPVASAGGLYMLDQAGYFSGENVTAETLAQTREKIERERAAIEDAGGPANTAEAKAVHEAVAHRRKAVLGASEYLAAAALGLIAGGLATRRLMLEIEYHADRVGARLAADGRKEGADAMINALKRATYANAQISPEESREMLKKIKPADMLNELFVNPHPSHADRFRQLEALKANWAQEMHPDRLSAHTGWTR